MYLYSFNSIKKKTLNSFLVTSDRSYYSFDAFLPDDDPYFMPEVSEQQSGLSQVAHLTPVHAHVRIHILQDVRYNLPQFVRLLVRQS